VLQRGLSGFQVFFIALAVANKGFSLFVSPCNKSSLTSMLKNAFEPTTLAVVNKRLVVVLWDPNEWNPFRLSSPTFNAMQHVACTSVLDFPPFIILLLAGLQVLVIVKQKITSVTKD
jgi:hypothetical protein